MEAIGEDSRIQGAHQMTPIEQWRLRIYVRLVQLRRRYVPMLVWHNDEVDVVVTFKEDILRAADIGEAMAQFASPGSLYEAKRHLNEIGISFDSGIGMEGRDWEWDWSLRGPISVRFRRRAKRPELRV